jgi:hypothetical protein
MSVIPPKATTEQLSALSNYTVKRHLNVPVPDCYYSDMVDNFFLADVETIRQVRWDKYFKLGEHEDFFWRAKQLGVKSAFCFGKGLYS